MQKLSLTASTFHKMAKLALGEPTEHVKSDDNKLVEVNLYDKLDANSRADISELRERWNSKNVKSSGSSEN
jgi:hypothetical protein